MQLFDQVFSQFFDEKVCLLLCIFPQFDQAATMCKFISFPHSISPQIENVPFIITLYEEEFVSIICILCSFLIQNIIYIFSNQYRRLYNYAENIFLCSLHLQLFCIYQNIYPNICISYNIISSQTKNMQSAKGSSIYKFEHYDLTLTIFNEKKLQITVIDPHEKMEFHEKMLTLSNIGTSTLVKALEKKTLQIKMSIKLKKSPEAAVLQIDVLVASQFLKPVEETIYLKKTKDISQTELLKSAITILSGKTKSIKENDKSKENLVLCGTIQNDEKLYNSNNANYEQFASINLKKGKYLLTLSFLTKITNQHMYIYFQQGQGLLTNNGFFVPNMTHFIPMTIRKVVTASNDNQNFKFQTYCSQSYPSTLKNIVLTAQPV